MTPETDHLLRKFADQRTLLAAEAMFILDLEERGLRSLREALRNTPSDIVAFEVGGRYRYATAAVFKQAKLESYLNGHNTKVPMLK